MERKQTKSRDKRGERSVYMKLLIEQKKLADMLHRGRATTKAYGTSGWYGDRRSKLTITNIK